MLVREEIPQEACRVHSFRATSGPVIRVRRGNVEAMIASEAARPPRTVAQYRDPRDPNTMPTWELEVEGGRDQTDHDRHHSNWSQRQRTLQHDDPARARRRSGHR